MLFSDANLYKFFLNKSAV